MVPYAYGGVVHVARIVVYSNGEWKMRYYELFIMFLKLLHLLYNDCLIYTLNCVSLQTESAEEAFGLPQNVLA